jgi:hypothetical protein
MHKFIEILSIFINGKLRKKMNIELDESQKKLLLETLAVAWQIEYMKGKSNNAIGNIIQAIAESLEKEGNEKIFFSVFQEFSNG